MHRGKHSVPAERGFTYLVMLIALAVFGLGLAALGESWSAAARRDQEAELIMIGKVYVRAIGSYYMRSPGSVRKFPATLEDLLEDTRFAGTERHLRRIYADPVTRGGQWGLIRAADGGIMGVHSRSDQPVLRKQPLALPNGYLVSGARYADWQFVFLARD